MGRSSGGAYGAWSRSWGEREEGFGNKNEGQQSLEPQIPQEDTMQTSPPSSTKALSVMSVQASRKQKKSEVPCPG